MYDMRALGLKHTLTPGLLVPVCAVCGAGAELVDPSRWWEGFAQDQCLWASRALTTCPVSGPGGKGEMGMEMEMRKGMEMVERRRDLLKRFARRITKASELVEQLLCIHGIQVKKFENVHHVLCSLIPTGLSQDVISVE
ncbi:hypothetical protein BGX38DRAFT_239188 [Terfezia claveryi]|nr:hypothetical protein BGX38DRAFT_239188 [Terfezia claveryi]